MSKNLIRNGGFERGDTQFWTCPLAKSFEAVDVDVHRGTYAGKVVINNGVYPSLYITDYLELSVGEIGVFEMFLKANVEFGVHFYMKHYDEDLNEVTYFRVEPFNLTTAAYTKYLWAFTGIEGATYVMPVIYINNPTEDNYMLIDNVSFFKMDPKTLVAREHELYYKSNISAAATYYGESFFSGGFTQAEFRLEVDICSGTSETLDVTIESKGIYDEFWHTIATFAQVTAADNIQLLAVTAALGTVLRAKLVVGGSPTTIDVRVVGVLKS